MEWCVIKWPPNSPDLNPIEHIWHRLKVNIQKNKRRPKSNHELSKAIKEAWNDLDLGFLNKLVERMPRRIAEVIKANGGNTRY